MGASWALRNACTGGSRLGARTLALAMVLGAAPRGHAQPFDDGFRRLDTGVNYRVTVHRALGFVRGIEQTQDGYLWFATSLGLARYDGLTFVFFDSANTPEIRDDHIVGLVKGDNDELWFVSARGGLVRLYAGRFTRFPFPDEIGRGMPTCVQLDASGRVWVGTDRSGLFYYHQGSWGRGLLPGVYSTASISAIYRNSSGALLVSAQSQWWQIEGTEIVPLPPARHNDLSPTEILLDWMLPPGGPRVRDPMFDAVRNRPFDHLRIGNDGAIWLGNPELVRVTAHETVPYGHRDGLASPHVQSVFEDRAGGLWIGHFGTGITQMIRTPFYPLTVSQGLGGGAAFSIVELDDGTVWVSGSGFLAEFKDGKFKNHIPNQERPLFGLRSLAAGKDSFVWANSTTAKVYRFNGTQHAIYTLPKPAWDEFATAIFVAADGVPWAASSHGGLLRLSGDRFVRVPVPELGPPGCAPPITLDFPCPHAINILAARRAGGLWLGTHGRGLWVREQDGRTHQVQPGLLDQAVVFSLHEDPETNGLWVGTDEGLFWLPLGAGTAAPYRFTRLDGLVSDGIFEIREDGLKRLWLGCDRGIFYARKADLLARAREKRGPVDVVSYRAVDGIPSDEVIRRFEPHGLRDRAGRLWFATVAGLAIFNPPEQEGPPEPPRALIEHVRLKREQFSAPLPGVAPRIEPGAGDIEFHYTAPSFTGAHRVRFHYKLDGFDTSFIDAGTRRFASYTNLAPGDYVFRVFASSAEAGASSVHATFAFTLLPHFHETAAFYVLVAALLLLLALGVQRMRIRQVKARYAAIEAERSRIARDLHDTLAQVFSAMGFQLDSIATLTQEDVVKDRLRRVRQMLGHGRLAARNVILNLRGERVGAPAGRALQAMLEAIPPVYDTAQVEVTIAGQPRPLQAAIENELFHIAQEAVSNAIEHGKAQLVSIELEYLPERTTLMIHDNGVGFAGAPGDTSLRFGLRGMRERAARVGATFEVVTEPGVGTEISVSIPAVPTPHG